MKLEDMSFMDYMQAEYEWKEKQKGAGIMNDNKPCKHAEMGCDGWECADHQKVKCDKQVYDYNPDGQINIVLCCEGKDQE